MVYTASFGLSGLCHCSFVRSSVFSDSRSLVVYVKQLVYVKKQKRYFFERLRFTGNFYLLFFINSHPNPTKNQMLTLKLPETLALILTRTLKKY